LNHYEEAFSKARIRKPWLGSSIVYFIGLRSDQLLSLHKYTPLGSSLAYEGNCFGKANTSADMHNILHSNIVISVLEQAGSNGSLLE
jgi:hypothetical protein